MPIFSGESVFLDTEGEGAYCTKECFGLHLDFCEGEARKEAERRARESVIRALRSIIRRVNRHPRLEALPGELWDEAMCREENIRAEEARRIMEGESHE
jgi:hypothetical protein